MSWLHDKKREAEQYGRLILVLARVSDYLSEQAGKQPDDEYVTQLFHEVQYYLRNPV